MVNNESFIKMLCIPGVIPRALFKLSSLEKQFSFEEFSGNRSSCWIMRDQNRMGNKREFPCPAQVAFEHT